jgi:hypothetical protein
VFAEDWRQKRTAGKSADVAHLPLDRFAQILKQMEAVSDLLGLGRALTNSLCVEPASIAADDLDLGMLREPFRCLLRRSDRQHVKDVATLQINDDRPIGDLTDSITYFGGSYWLQQIAEAQFATGLAAEPFKERRLGDEDFFLDQVHKGRTRA